MLTEEAVLNQIARRVDLINDGVGVPVVSCSEDSDFEVNICNSEQLVDIWSLIHGLLEGAIVATRSLHLDIKVWFIFFIEVGELGQLKLIFVAH